MNKALTALKALIMKSRPAYKDYIGKETIKTLLCHDDYKSASGSDQILVPLEDSTFKGFANDEKYTLEVNGEELELGVVNGGDMPVAVYPPNIRLSGSDGSPPEGLEYIVYLDSHMERTCLGFEIVNPIEGDVSFKLYRERTATKYDIKKLPEECLPDSVDRNFMAARKAIQKADEYIKDVDLIAEDALDLASTANAAAQSAQTSADKAQQTADYAKIETKIASATIEFGGNTWVRNGSLDGGFVTTVFGDGVWVACKNHGKDVGLYYSSNGQEWIKSNVSSGYFRNIAYGNKSWVASGGLGVYYSVDGKSWSLSNITTGRFANPVYSNGVWIIPNSNYSGEVTGLYYSIDGTSWAQSNIATGQYNPPVYANGTWIASGHSNGSRGILYSTDGKTWEQSNITEGGFLAPVWGNDTWIVPCDYEGSYYSADGKTWTRIEGITDWALLKPVYANGIWVAVGNGKSGLFYSTDGKTWEQSNSFSTYYFWNIVYNNGVWVAISTVPSHSVGICYSTDGKIWAQTTIKTGSYSSLVCSNRIWIAVDGTSQNKSSAVYSIDGKVWKFIEGLPANSLYGDPVYGNGVWVISGRSNPAVGVWYSLSQSALAESIAERINVLRPDWGENDITSQNYISGRTHSYRPAVTLECTTESMSPVDDIIIEGKDIYFVPFEELAQKELDEVAEEFGKQWHYAQLKASATLYKVFATYVDEYHPTEDCIVSFIENEVALTSGTRDGYYELPVILINGQLGSKKRVTCKINRFRRGFYFFGDATLTRPEKYYPLDEKYIPSTIQRVETGMGAHKQLVTDENGARKWEDRLGYKTIEDVVILPETTKEADSSTFKYYDEPANFINEGGTYVVTLDGVEYDCAPVKVDSIGLILGNPGKMNAGEDNGLPFLFIGFYRPNMGTISAFSDTNAHTYSIKGKQPIYTPIPGEYIAGGLFKGEGNSSFRTKDGECSGDYSVAFGANTVEGTGNVAVGIGNKVTSSGWAFASGANNTVTGQAAAALGEGLTSTSPHQLVVGRYNKRGEDNANYVFVAGNGEPNEYDSASGTIINNSSDAYTVDWDGNTWAAGTAESAGVILRSSTENSDKKFKLTVDDSGAIAADEGIKIPKDYIDGLDSIEATGTEAKRIAETMQRMIDVEKTDGKAWIQSNITTGGFKNVAYLNGLWIAYSWGDSGIYYSEDGKEWTQSNITTASFICIAYENGIFVAIGGTSDVGIFYSEDGKKWTQSNILEGLYLGPVYGNGLWMCGSSDDDGLIYSEDGKEWTQSNIADGFVRAPIYGNGIWATFKSNGGFYYSTDGKEWTLGTAVNAYCRTIDYADGVWVAVTDSKVFRSTDGKAWAQQTLSCTDVRHADRVNNLWIVASGADGMYYSADGETWAQSNIVNKILDRITFANGVYVATAADGSGLYYSFDGKTWAQSNITSGTADFSYGNGLWMAVSTSVYNENVIPGICYSLDGKVWQQTDVTTGTYCTPVYANGIWVIGGSNDSCAKPGLFYSDSKYATSATLDSMKSRVDALENKTENIAKTVGGVAPDENGDVSPSLFLQYFPMIAGDDVSNGHTYDEIVSYIKHMPNCICYREGNDVRFLQSYMASYSSEAALMGYLLSFGEGIHEVYVDASTKKVTISSYHTSTPILADAEGNKWKLIVGTDGALSTEAITT